ncbi:unnamed protein product [Fusarium graminearum]|nr:unnamed protein product [Fusarium graminearum]
MAGRHKPIRLPPLKTLRVHNPKRQVENPCIAIMSSVLGRSLLPCSLYLYTRKREGRANNWQHAGLQQVTTQQAAQQ